MSGVGNRAFNDCY